MARPKLEDFYDQDKFYKAKELVPIYVSMVQALDEYCDELESINKKLEDKLYIISHEPLTNPFDGCMDCCYKNNDCKSNGSCRKYRGI